MITRKPKLINLYKWKLFDKVSWRPVSDVFVVDRGDNKRRTTRYLKSKLLQLSGLQDYKGLTIGGYEAFRGFAASYNVKE